MISFRGTKLPKKPGGREHGPRAAYEAGRDLEAAGISVETPDGRIDFHSLRVMFVTGLARGGVHPRKALQLARHSSIELTMRVYTKFQTSELASCLDCLPDTPDVATAAKAG